MLLQSSRSWALCAGLVVVASARAAPGQDPDSVVDPSQEPDRAEANQESKGKSDQGFERVEFRVTTARNGYAMIDRGTRDGLRKGDRVFFLPREGGTYPGIVDAIDDRSATIELADPGFLPGPGTRGAAQVPADRFVDEGAPPSEGTGDAAATEPGSEVPEHPEWENKDEEFKSGQPLLAKVQPVRPEERPKSVHARTYMIGDQIWSSEDDREDSFLRLGADVEIENLTGRGDMLHLEGEINYRRTQVPDDDDENQGRLRPERFSYSWGGTRFAPERIEIGRFLSNGMSEFGVVDGVEWGRRLENGHTWGVSAGWMPEPDKSFESLQDFQVSGYYRWIADASEQLSAAAGFQKTFHNSDADRDLLVTKLAYLPMQGWNFLGTAWVDYYTSGDDAKGSGLGLTQLYMTSGTRSKRGDTLDFVYSHIEFPEIDREEFLPIEDDQLADDHNDRLAMRLRSQVTPQTRWTGSIGVWADEDEEGADGELGIERRNWIFQNSVSSLSLYGVNGRHSDALGWRTALAWDAPGGRWAAEYEFGLNQVDVFDEDNNDIPQHRLRVNRDYQTLSGWNFSGSVELGFWDDENSVGIGIYIQRSY